MIVMRVKPGLAAARALTDIKLIAARFPGDQKLQLLVSRHKLTLGSEWRYEASPQCLAALGEFGEVLEPTPS